MPKATKSHREKKSGYGAEAWARRKKETNAGDTLHKEFQKMYRIACLRQRIAEGRMTEKNLDEAKRLGVS